jgi:hypothetical protein
VPPDTTPLPPADQLAGNQDGRRGFRTPCLVISPFARRDTVSSTVLDHTSILKMIEWRWNLEPLTVRDATATNLAEILSSLRQSSRQSSSMFRLVPSAAHARQALNTWTRSGCRSCRERLISGGRWSCREAGTLLGVGRAGLS